VLRLDVLSRRQLAQAQTLVAERHYLRKPVDARCSVEGYRVSLDVTLLDEKEPARYQVGVFLLGRPQATSCFPWYGSVEDVARGRAEVTRWQVLNLARVWFSPRHQPGGDLHGPDFVPGFTDRRGTFRSKLGSSAIALLAARVVVDYLVARPPCFLEEPYELRWLLSYCDTRLHRGTLYRASGFELFRTNAEGIQTWRLPLRPLTAAERERVEDASHRSPRSIEHRARRAQLPLEASA